MRLIDADFVTQWAKIFCPNNKQLISAIEKAPTVDTAVHGRYIIDDMGDCSCSECGSMYINCTDFYCPTCGAKMAPYEP